MTEPDPSGLPAGEDLADLDVLDEDGPAGDDVDPAGAPPDAEESDADGDGGGLRATPVDDRARAEAVERRLVELEDRLATAQAAARAAAQTAVGAAAEAQIAAEAAAAVEAAAHAAAEAAAQAEPAPVVKAPKYQALAEFVSNEFSPLYTRRRHGGRWRWCTRWWEHAEAVSRLGALHLAWEALHDDGPTGLGTWYRDHLDHQLPILMGADGPFRRCDDQHYPLDPDDELTCGTPHGDNIVWRIN